MMVLADQDTGTRVSKAASRKSTPATMVILALAVSSCTQLVHWAPTSATRSPKAASRMDTTMRARAACRSCGSASSESYTLHCIWPVLCTTQFIHRPSQVICAVMMLLPMKAVTPQTIWEGLWMNCVVQSTGQMQCKVYDSLLALPQDLQAARALMVVSIILAALGVLLSVVGGKCTNCVEDESAKAKTMIVAGVVFLLAGLLVMVPASWTANNIIRDFYNPLVVSGQKREMGASLYVGWAASGLLLLGGALLCCNCPPRADKPYSAKYSAAARSAPASNYV
uniref:Claudin-4 n=1 Tax=Canis lupus familiaris TaxID=9615 RepID=A0A8C0S6Y7_CANLF